MPKLNTTAIDVIKRPHVGPENYNETELLQLFECVDKPLYFMENFMKVQHAIKGAMPFKPYPYQVRMIEAFHQHRFCIALTGRQLGKALALNTPLPTPTGWTTMGEVNVGDQLLGDDGKPTIITFATDVMFDHDCYDIEFDNGEIITADAEHIWKIDSRLLTTKQIIPLLKSGAVYVAASDPLDLPEVDLAVKPNLMSGDNVSRNKKGKHIPQEYLRGSFEQRLALLETLLDFDGFSKASAPDIYQKDKKFVEQVHELIASLGMKARIRTKIVNGEMLYRIKFDASRMDILRMASEHTSGIHVKQHRFFIRNIKQAPSVPVRCIQVDNESQMFLCGRSMIPTHNTTCAAGYLLWKAMFTPDTTILVTANKFVQAIEIVDRIKYAYENLPDHIRAGVIEYNKSTITFDNGSRIISRATSPDAGRGLSISLLYLDEFSYVATNKSISFWTSMQPTLATGGACIITSTPKSDEDQFAQIWKGAIDNVNEWGNPRPGGVGKNNFYAIKVTWREHPDRDEEWAKTYREQLGEARFRQEMECDFITDDETLINPLTLVRLSGIQPIQYTGTVRWFCEPQPNKTYLLALDPSLGTGGDYAAIQVFQLPEMIQVAEWQHNGTAPRGQVRILMQTALYLDSVLREHPQQLGVPEIYWTVENNSIGEAILQIIEDTGEERFPGHFISEKRRKGQVRRFRKGMYTTNKNKLSGCARMKSLVESGRATINSANLIKQLKTFVAKETSFSAKPGEHDDLVMAFLLIVRMLDVAVGWSSNVGDLKEYIDDEELIDSEPMPMVF